MPALLSPEATFNGERAGDDAWCTMSNRDEHFAAVAGNAGVIPGAAVRATLRAVMKTVARRAA